MWASHPLRNHLSKAVCIWQSLHHAGTLPQIRFYIFFSILSVRPGVSQLRSRESSLVRLQKLLPSSRLQPNASQKLPTLLQVLTSIVTRLINEEMVLEHLVSHGSHRASKETLVRRSVDGHETGRLASDLLKLGNDPRGRVVVLGCQDLLPEDGALIANCRDDVLACKIPALASDQALLGTTHQYRTRCR